MMGIQNYMNKNMFMKDVKPSFGYNGMGQFVYDRTYSRIKEDNEKEQWYDTIYRVVNWTFGILEKEIGDLSKINETADEMFELMYNFKFLPSGRGLWACGTNIIEKKGGMALNSCAFVSFKGNEQYPEKPFIFLMDCLCLGVGVGYDTHIEGIKVYGPSEEKILYEIEDTREGFVKSVHLLLSSYFYENKKSVYFTYDKIRKAGIKLKIFGGTSSGPEPLKELHITIRDVLDKYINKTLNSRAISDIMCMIAKCVVSGNSRRGATIALGKLDDKEFINLKNYDLNPERVSYGYMANNSVIIDKDQDSYIDICNSFKKYSEPGIIFMDNMKKYSRLCDDPDYKDINVSGTNPCGEQALESFEVCNLVEVFLNRIDNFDDFIKIIKYALLYGKIVTTIKTHWAETNSIIEKNRRIGLSLSGIVNFISKYNKDVLIDWCKKGYTELRKYDVFLSKLLNINESIKITSIKPSGTISLLAGATSGCHYPMYKYYIRRVRVNKNDSLVSKYAKLGYKIEQDVIVKDNLIIEFPIKLEDNILVDPSIEDQIDLACLLQKYWSDNNVSFTCVFDKDTDTLYLDQIIKKYRNQLKGISFMPNSTDNYPQQPYEEISKETYYKLINSKNENNEYLGKKQFFPGDKYYCDGEYCLNL